MSKERKFSNVLPSPYAWQWVRDLHLKTGSIPVNAGANLGSPYNVDIDGKTRGADGAWDIGAYEAQSGATAAAPSAVVSPAQLVFGAVAVGATSRRLPSKTVMLMGTVCSLSSRSPLPSSTQIW